MPRPGTGPRLGSQPLAESLGLLLERLTLLAQRGGELSSMLMVGVAKAEHAQLVIALDAHDGLGLGSPIREAPRAYQPHRSEWDATLPAKSQTIYAGSDPA